MACVTALFPRMQIQKKKRVVYVLTDLTLCLDTFLFTHASRNSTGAHDRSGKQKNALSLYAVPKFSPTYFIKYVHFHKFK